MLRCLTSGDSACQILRSVTATETPAPLDYVERVNRGIDHVLSNLSSPLRLEDVARAACFSPFHFHRVFRSLVGETLQQFVKRQRLERALRMMAHAPLRSLTEVALDCGFSSSSDFSRNFKTRYGVAPSAFDLQAWRDEKRGEMLDVVANSACKLVRLPPGENPDGFEVVLRDLEPRRVAYIRVTDPYRPLPQVPDAPSRADPLNVSLIPARIGTS